MSKIKVDRIENSSGNGFTFPSSALSDGYLQVSSAGVLSSGQSASNFTKFKVYDGATDTPLESAAQYTKTIPQNIRELMIKHPFRIISNGIVSYDHLEFHDDAGSNMFFQSQNPDMWLGMYPAGGGFALGRQYFQRNIIGHPNGYRSTSSSHANSVNCWMSVLDCSMLTYNEASNGVSNATRDKTKIATLLGRQHLSLITDPQSRQDQYNNIVTSYINKRFYFDTWSSIHFQNLITGTSPLAQIQIIIRGAL